MKDVNTCDIEPLETLPWRRGIWLLRAKVQCVILKLRGAVPRLVILV